MYQLTLTTQDGLVLESWRISATEDGRADLVYPLQKMGPMALAADINRAIKRSEADNAR